MSWSEGEGQDGIHSLSSLKTALQAIKCVPNLKPASESKHQDKVASFTERLGGVPQSTVCSVPWVWEPAKNHPSNCYSPTGRRSAGPSPGHQSQTIKGHPLGGSHKNQGSRCKNQHTRHVQRSTPRDTGTLERDR